MPEAASTWAEQVDLINAVITWAAVFCTVGVVGAMVYFAIRYRRKPNERRQTPNITHNTKLEIVWTVIPSIICVFVFYYGFDVYREMRTPPPSNFEINVVGYKWAWSFTYPNGKRTTNELVVPVGEPVRLVMTSKDVIHSFFIPAMRVKEDVRPGAYSYLWFTPTKVGEFHVFCAEYCGTQHSKMLANLRVLSKPDFEAFLLERGKKQLPPAELGKKLYTQVGCNACHSLDGSRLVGPSLKGLYGAERKFADGTTELADENYVQRSILYPAEQVVEGYQLVMQSYKDQLDEEQLNGLIAYIKTLGQSDENSDD